LTETAAVAIQDVSFAYAGQPVVRDASFSIAAGDFVSVVGPNGGGKTTLLKLILGLLEPDRGTVRVLGRTPKQARGRVGYMPQRVDVDPKFPATVRDVVLMGRLGRLHPIGPFGRRDLRIATDALAACDATELASRPFAALSGGQRQRVLIARAVACDPELLLLDEPTASLDPDVQDELYELLHRLNERMTVVLVSHDVATVSHHCRRVVCVNVDVALHDTAAIGPELARLFPGHTSLRAVRHDHAVPPEAGASGEVRPESGSSANGAAPAEPGPVWDELTRRRDRDA
jgi:zinc transport system ATP-binding protein